MEKKIKVYLNQTPSFTIDVRKDSKIGFVRKYLKENYPNYSGRFYINSKTELKVLDDDRYDDISFESIFSQMKNPSIKLWSNKTLTGDKNLDLMILSNLDDHDLINFCLTNKYAKGLCENQNFWRNRFVDRFGEEYLEFRPEEQTWKNYYLSVLKVLSQWKDPWIFFDKIAWKITEPLNDKPSFIIDGQIVPYGIDLGSDIVTGYYLLNLGTDIKIAYPRDRYQELEPEVREYHDDNFFSPSKVMKLVEDYYNEFVTKEELDRQKEVDNPYAEDLTDADIGKIQRKDLIPLYFEGFDTLENGTRFVSFGS